MNARKSVIDEQHIPDDVLHGTFFERDVPLDKMFIHTRDQPGGYARPLNPRRVAKLDAEFNPKALGVILLSMRNDGTFAVIDGQHRGVVARLHGMTALDAYVYIDLTVEQEAELYAQFGDYLKQTARDRWFAAIAARKPEYLAIERILGEFGLRVTNDAGKTGGIAAVETIMYITKQYGPHILRETLRSLGDAFAHDPVAYGGAPLRGMAAFLSRVGSDARFKRSRLIQRLNRMGAAKWEQQAMHVFALDRGEKGRAFGRALLIIHDQGVKDEYKIGDWQDRVLKPEHIEAARGRMALLNAPSAQEARRAGIQARAMEVRCRTCHASKGKLCHDTPYIHMGRVRDAARARRERSAS